MVTRILVLKEKHGDWHFDASTPELLHAACLKIVKKRNESGYFYNFDENAEEPVPPVLPSENPPVYVKNAYEVALKKYKQELRFYREERENIEELKEALLDGEKAYYFLLGRNNCEYEAIELLELSDPERYCC